MNVSHAVIALSLSSLCLGCSTIAENYRVTAIMVRATSDANSIYRSDGKAVDLTSTAFKTRVAAVATDVQRNDLQRELMVLSDDVCELHMAGIISSSNTWNISTGSITNVLAGLGAVVGGEAAKASLSAGAALSNSTRALVNQQIYSDALAPTVVRAIRRARAEAKTLIEAAMGRDLARYSVWAAIFDVDEYHRRCSFIVGVAEVTQALENRKESKAEVKSRIELLRREIAANAAMSPKLSSPRLLGELEKLQLQLSTAPE